MNYKAALEQLRNTPPSEVQDKLTKLGYAMYVFMNSGDLDIPNDTLVIKWKPTADGLILSLDYNSTEDEQVAYEKFTEACNQAVIDNVLPVVLGKPFWYSWKEITESSLPKQYTVIHSIDDGVSICTLHWDSRYEANFFAR